MCGCSIEAVGIGSTTARLKGHPQPQHPDGSLAAGIAARLAARLGRRPLTAGSLLAALAWTIHEAGAGIHAWQLLAPLAAGGLGMGATVPAADRDRPGQSAST